MDMALHVDCVCKKTGLLLISWHAIIQAWELFFLVASTMPPSKEFVGLVSEYVHTVAHGEADGDEEAQKLARRAWGGLKRSAKAGTRRTVSACACVQ